MTKRQIAPIKLLGPVEPALIGKRPEVTWIAPTDIRVEERYQRGVGERGRRLIASICAAFDWRLWRLPVCVWTDEGLEAIDGQHSLIAAATLGLEEVPIMIVEAPELENRAALFVSANKDRIAVSRLQMHVAAVLAGDKAALTIERLCARLRIKILKVTPAEGKYQPRDTMAVAAIAGLLKRYSEGDTEKMLAVVANMEAAPISVALIKAVELLLADSEFAETIDGEAITAAAVSLPEFGDQEAKLFAATHRVPQWRALASIWFRTAKKMPRKAPKPATPSPAQSPVIAQPSPRAFTRPSYQPAGFSFGDPPPGRSALDQRKAASL